MSDSELKALEFNYKFILADGRVQQFRISLDSKTLQLLNPPKPPYPSWADLKYRQCPNCPLNEKEFPQCPPAAYLSGFVHFAAGLDSFEEADIEINVTQRTYRKRAAVQYGLSSLMGIYMTTSGCPILDQLRPMVKTHLPFAKGDEVTYRVVSMYLLAQFFKMKQGKAADWDLTGLLVMNREIQIVNQHFRMRISAADLQMKDAGVNALTHLDTLAKLAAYQLEDAQLEDLKPLFTAYLKGDSRGV